MAIKTCLNRDAATRFLRKNGVAKEFYNQLIYTNGRKLCINVEDMLALLKPKTKAVVDVPKVLSPTEQYALKGNLKRDAKIEGKKLGTAAQIRQLIKDGRSNEEIRTVLNLPETKRHYPQYYRNQLSKEI